MSGFSNDHNMNNNNVPHEDQYYASSSSGHSGIVISEIEEEHEGSNDVVSSEIEEELFDVKRFSPMPSITEEHDKVNVLSAAENSVYVAVGKGLSSVYALDWALKHSVNYSSSTVVYLIHIYPEIKQIPTPLGKLPLSQVSPEQVETHMAQERGKRRELLQKFLNKCSAANVNVDTILIESDGLTKAILDLIDILNIRKLVIGTAKSNLRKLKSRKGSGTADQILKSAPESCEVKIICEGIEVVIDQAIESPSHRGEFDSPKEYDNSKSIHEDEQVEETDVRDKRNDAISCMCFKSKHG